MMVVHCYYLSSERFFGNGGTNKTSFCLLLVASLLISSLRCCLSFSTAAGGGRTTTTTSSSSLLLLSSCSSNLIKANLLETKNPEPIILFLPEIFSPDRVSELLQTIETSELIQTNSYQEDVFSKDVWFREDETFRSIVEPLVKEKIIPPEYRCTTTNNDNNDNNIEEDSAALKLFLYAVTNYPNKIKEEDIILGANIIRRRQALERWQSKEGKAVMQLSLDNDDDNDNAPTSLGKRYQLPVAILLELQQQLLPRIFFFFGKESSWTVTDATLVRYREGDSQVPHTWIRVMPRY